MRALPIVVILLASASVAAAPASPRVDPKADAALQGLAKSFGEAKSFAADLDVVVILEQGPNKNRGEFQYGVMMQRPNRIGAVLRKGDGMTVLSDGKNLYRHVPSIKQYTVEPAPASLGKALGGGNPFAGDLFAPLWDLLDGLSAPDPRAALTEKAARIQWVGGDPAGEQQIRITRERVSVDYWIRGTSPAVVTRMVPDFTGLGSGMRIQMNAVFRNWRVGATLNSAQFAFVAGPGDTRVDELGAGPAHPLKGKPAPALAASMLDGTPFDLAKHKGKSVVVLEFWATWCGPCRMTLPVMQKLVNAYKGRPVVFVAVNLGDSAGQVRGFLNRQGYTGIPCALDEEARSGATWQADSIPMTAIVDKSGKVVEVHQGYWDGYEMSLRGTIDGLLAKK